MRVLIVEDESGIARTLDQYLRREGFQTEVAATGERARSLARLGPALWSSPASGVKSGPRS